MITRQELLDKKFTHEEYFGQFVTDTIKSFVAKTFGDRIIMSEDNNFSNIPLQEWDNAANMVPVFHASLIRKADEKHGGTLSDRVCVLKEAARQIREADPNVI